MRQAKRVDRRCVKWGPWTVFRAVEEPLQDLLDLMLASLLRGMCIVYFLCFGLFFHQQMIADLLRENYRF
jgi:hypothetical protein